MEHVMAEEFRYKGHRGDHQWLPQSSSTAPGITDPNQRILTYLNSYFKPRKSNILKEVKEPGQSQRLWGKAQGWECRLAQARGRTRHQVRSTV